MISDSSRNSNNSDSASTSSSPVDLGSFSAALSCLSSLTSLTVDALSSTSLTRYTVLNDMRHYLRRLNISEKQINDLNVIHIAGTKGKGSTAAFTANILKQKGFKTAHWRSRRPSSNAYLFQISNTIGNHYFQRRKGSDDYIKSYANGDRCIRVYKIADKVGMGGRLDATNVFSHPIVCGITSIGLDHMEVLGTTIKQIAREKGGICKPKVVVWSVPQQSEAMSVLLECAAEENSILRVIQPIKSNQSSASSTPSSSVLKLGLDGEHQNENASLAIALVGQFLELNRKTDSSESSHYESTLRLVNLNSNTSVSPFPPCYEVVSPYSRLPFYVLSGLSSTIWPGRCQFYNLTSLPNLYFYLDGAHTDQSIKLAGEWFIKKVKQFIQSPNNTTQTTISTNETKSPSHDDFDFQQKEVLHHFPLHSLNSVSISPSSSSSDPLDYFVLLVNIGHTRNPLDLLYSLFNIADPTISNPISFSSQFGHILTFPFDSDRLHLNSPQLIDQIITQTYTNQQEWASFKKEIDEWYNQSGTKFFLENPTNYKSENNNQYISTDQGTNHPSTIEGSNNNIKNINNNRKRNSSTMHLNSPFDAASSFSQSSTNSISAYLSLFECCPTGKSWQHTIIQSIHCLIANQIRKRKQFVKLTNNKGAHTTSKHFTIEENLSSSVSPSLSFPFPSPSNSLSSHVPFFSSLPGLSQSCYPHQSFVHSNTASAVHHVLKLARQFPNTRFHALAIGSLYLVGDLLKQIKQVDHIKSG